VAFISEENSYDNVIKDNTVNDKPLIYINRKSNRTIKNVDIGQLILVKCKNINIESLRISNTTVGIQLIENKE